MPSDLFPMPPPYLPVPRGFARLFMLARRPPLVYFKPGDRVSHTIYGAGVVTDFFNTPPAPGYVEGAWMVRIKFDELKYRRRQLFLAEDPYITKLF